MDFLPSNRQNPSSICISTPTTLAEAIRLLVAHQRALGVQKTVFLPAGSKYGLAADCGGDDTVMNLARKYPKEFFYFANELPDIPEKRPVIEKYLKDRSHWHWRAEVPSGLRLGTYRQDR